MIARGRNYVTYYRVSTARQGRSGLGLDAQKTAVRAYLDGHGGNELGSGPSPSTPPFQGQGWLAQAP